MCNDKPAPVQFIPIHSVEMTEYLFANTLTRVAAKCVEDKHNVIDWKPLVDQIRGSMRMDRFNVLNWLRMNGVEIPVELMSDQMHPVVGEQYPDQSILKASP